MTFFQSFSSSLLSELLFLDARHVEREANVTLTPGTPLLGVHSSVPDVSIKHTFFCLKAIHVRSLPSWNVRPGDRSKFDWRSDQVSVRSLSTSYSPVFLVDAITRTRSCCTSPRSP